MKATRIFFTVGLFAVGLASLFASEAENKFNDALKRLEASGKLAQEGKFVEAQQIMNAAFTDLDSALAAEPKNLIMRMKRGSLYYNLPEFMNKRATAKEDLALVVQHPEYLTLPDATRTKIGNARKAMGVGESTPRDRFPLIGDNVSPLIAAASVTLPPGAPRLDRKNLTGLFATMMEKLEKSPGFLASHIVESVDKPGMVIVFTWWKDKQALNGWFYGEGHQSMIRQTYGNASAQQSGEGPSQVAMEVFSMLPGGVQVRGGFNPSNVPLKTGR